MPMPILGTPANAWPAHTHGLTCWRAPHRSHEPTETQTAAPGFREQEKAKKLAPRWGSIRWAECLCHKLGVQRTSQCPQAAAGWRFRSARTATASKTCRLSCNNRAATFSSGGKDATDEFAEKGILVGVNKWDDFSLECRWHAKQTFWALL